MILRTVIKGVSTGLALRLEKRYLPLVSHHSFPRHPCENRQHDRPLPPTEFPDREHRQLGPTAPLTIELLQVGMFAREPTPGKRHRLSWPASWGGRWGMKKLPTASSSSLPPTSSRAKPLPSWAAVRIPPPKAELIMETTLEKR